MTRQRQIDIRRSPRRTRCGEGRATRPAPYGCLGFYTTNIKADGSKYYKGIFYPKVKASMDGRTYNTKQKTIVLDSPKLTLSVDACNTGDYRIESDELTTETAAKTWVNGKVKAAVGG